MDDGDLDRRALDVDGGPSDGASRPPWSPPTIERLDCLDTAANPGVVGGTDFGIYSG